MMPLFLGPTCFQDFDSEGYLKIDNIGKASMFKLSSDKLLKSTESFHSTNTLLEALNKLQLHADTNSLGCLIFLHWWFCFLWTIYMYFYLTQTRQFMFVKSKMNMFLNFAPLAMFLDWQVQCVPQGTSLHAINRSRVT